MRVRETGPALRDLAEILNHLSERSRQGARNLVAAYEAARVQIAHMPYATVKIENLDVWRLPLVRFRYTIFYRIVPADDEVQILRIVHSARVKKLDVLPDDE